MNTCPCLTTIGHLCTKPPKQDFPFCPTHLNQLVTAYNSTNSFKRSRVLRTSFMGIDDELITSAVELWSERFHDVTVWTTPEGNLKTLIQILRVKGAMTTLSLTEAYNSIHQTKYSPTRIGRAMSKLVDSGDVSKRTTRAKHLTINKTSLYEIA